MIGANRHTGQMLAGDAHIAQSLVDILTTPTGSRVMRRTYGSRLPDLIDTPINGRSVIEFYVAAAEAIDAWEPRVELTRVAIDEASAKGRLGLTLSYRVDGREAQSGVLIEGAYS